MAPNVVVGAEERQAALDDVVEGFVGSGIGEGLGEGGAAARGEQAREIELGRVGSRWSRSRWED